MRTGTSMPVAAHFAALRTTGTSVLPPASSDRHRALPLRPDAPMMWTWDTMLLRLAW